MFIKPELSGGHHCDDNQTVTKQTKPIKARRTEPGSLYCTANLDQRQEAAARLKALRGRRSTSSPSSIFLPQFIFIRGGGGAGGGIKCFQDRPSVYWLLAAVSGRRASRWRTRGPPPGPALASPPPGGTALFGSGELPGSDLEREKRRKMKKGGREAAPAAQPLPEQRRVHYDAPPRHQRLRSPSLTAKTGPEMRTFKPKYLRHRGTLRPSFTG